jgi:hypothetical protein
MTNYCRVITYSELNKNNEYKSLNNDLEYVSIFLGNIAFVRLEYDLFTKERRKVKDIINELIIYMKSINMHSSKRSLDNKKDKDNMWFIHLCNAQDIQLCIVALNNIKF